MSKERVDFKNDHSTQRFEVNQLTPPSSPFRPSLHRAILGTLLVLAGLAAAFITILARRSNDYTLASVAAILSLIIAALLTIFIVPPLARSARLEIMRLDLPIQLTTGGSVFLLIILVVGFAAWNTGNNLLFLVFSLLCSTLFVGWMASRTSLHDIVVSARFPDHIFAGEPAPVIVTLRNEKRLIPSFSLLVEARGPVNEEPQRRRFSRQHFFKRPLAYFTYLRHHAATEQRVEQLFAKRGHVEINGFEISTRFPFGFFRRRKRLRARKVDIAVYPKPQPIGDELHLLPMYAGKLASVRRGAGHDLFSLRDYQPRDDLRHIDWKATARARRLTVREFTSEDERRITIVLDTRVIPEEKGKPFSARFERGVVQTASLVKHFIDERAEVRLILGSEEGRYGSGLEHLYASLRRLALVTSDAEERPDLLSTAGDRDAARTVEPVFGSDFAIVITTARPGTIPANIWRSSHVIFL